MSSPFPGMDPYLEEPAIWGGVHSRLINSMSDYLGERVAPDFWVDIESVYEEEYRERTIEIRDARNREVVTTIEVLSPFNKAAGASGRKAFLQKRKTIMSSKVHWIEIDLLRAGERPPELAGKSDYYALLKRGETPGPYEVWFFDLRDALPSIAVPLRPPFPDYSAPLPQPRLRPADAKWAETRVQEWLAARIEKPGG